VLLTGRAFTDHIDGADGGDGADGLTGCDKGADQVGVDSAFRGTLAGRPWYTADPGMTNCIALPETAVEQHGFLLRQRSAAPTWTRPWP
jgi:hypothetical protein